MQQIGNLYAALLPHIVQDNTCLFVRRQAERLNVSGCTVRRHFRQQCANCAVGMFHTHFLRWACRGAAATPRGKAQKSGLPPIGDLTSKTPCATVGTAFPWRSPCPQSPGFSFRPTGIPPFYFLSFSFGIPAFPADSVAFLRTAIALYKKSGRGAPSLPTFSRMLPISISRYQATTRGERRTV